MNIHQSNGKTIQVDNIHDYTRNQNPKHGKLGQIKTEDIKILEKTRTNYEDVNASVEEGKKIMYNFLINNDIATDINLPLSKYGFNCIKNILVFQHRDEKLLVNKYLFNIKTGEVYYINKILINIMSMKQLFQMVLNLLNKL